MSDINVGDVVRLKSGGVPMTVQSVEEGYADVVWQDGAKPMAHTYKVGVLEKSQGSDGPVFFTV